MFETLPKSLFSQLQASFKVANVSNHNFRKMHVHVGVCQPCEHVPGIAPGTSHTLSLTFITMFKGKYYFSSFTGKEAEAQKLS